MRNLTPNDYGPPPPLPQICRLLVRKRQNIAHQHSLSPIWPLKRQSRLIAEHYTPPVSQSKPIWCMGTQPLHAALTSPGCKVRAHVRTAWTLIELSQAISDCPWTHTTAMCSLGGLFNLLRRCTRRIRLSWRCVGTRGRPLLGRSVNLPVALRRWTKRYIVDSCTPNCCATSRCDRPCKIRAIALPLSSCDKRTISLNKLKQQTFCATDTNGTKVRFGNVLKSLPRDTTRAARI